MVNIVTLKLKTADLFVGVNKFCTRILRLHFNYTLESNKHITDDLNSYLKADLLSHNYNAPIGFYVCNCSCFQVMEK